VPVGADRCLWSTISDGSNKTDHTDAMLHLMTYRAPTTAASCLKLLSRRAVAINSDALQRIERAMS